MIAGGDNISAWRALEIGLVSEVLPDHELFDAAIALGERSPRSRRRRSRRSRICSTTRRSRPASQRERDAFVAAVDSPDGREGVAAFLQKRAPKFTQ